MATAMLLLLPWGARQPPEEDKDPLSLQAPTTVLTTINTRGPTYLLQRGDRIGKKVIYWAMVGWLGQEKVVEDITYTEETSMASFLLVLFQL